MHDCHILPRIILQTVNFSSFDLQLCYSLNLYYVEPSMLIILLTINYLIYIYDKSEKKILHYMKFKFKFIALVEHLILQGNITNL